MSRPRSRGGRLGLVPLLLSALLCAHGQFVLAEPAEPQFDIVIRNGRVLDGAGNPYVNADVAINEGRIAAFGHVLGRGREEINASGRYVSPGWIDMMDQSELSLLKNGLAENKLKQGITTLIAGEGGTPVEAGEIGRYLVSLEAQGISPNFGVYYSEAQARIAVLGYVDRAPDADELEQMRQLVSTAMRAGVLGLTTALIYPPMSYSRTEELIELAKVAGRYGGVYASHVRGEGRELLEAIDELIRIAEQSGAPAEVFHLKAAYRPGWGTLMKQAGERIEAARRRGLDIAADVYVYTAGSTDLEAVVPSWAHEGGREALLRRLADPGIRERLKAEIRSGSPGWWNIVEACGGWEGVTLVRAGSTANEKLEGKTLAAIGLERGVDPADAAFDLIAAGRTWALFHMMSEDDLQTALRFPWTSIGSDAGSAVGPGGSDLLGPHPRSYGNFPRVIARYVRDMPVLSLPEAVRKMSSWPATRMRLHDRGMIRAGMWADVVIFDLDRIRDRATYEQPYLDPEGIDYVLVNGRVVVANNRHTGARPGKVLYGPGRGQATDDHGH